MNTTLNRIAMLIAVLALGLPALAQSSFEIRTAAGTTWRGDLQESILVKFTEAGVARELNGRLVKVADLYILVEGDVAGELRQKLIVRDDILSIATVTADSGSDAKDTKLKRRTSNDATRSTRTKPAVATGAKGVFVLPLDGPVGEDFRYNEIEMIGEEADKYGRGQIIVLDINSNGGLVYESELITEAIWDIKKRHRVVAWVRKAISAGCQTAMACDEIYFRTDGTAGSVTTIRGLTHVPEAQAQKGIDFLVRVAQEAGHSEHIARSMKLTRFMCSYDKDPETGEVTFYGDLSGEFILSDAKSNLTFNSSTAMHCGFAEGIADTEEDLAKLLDLEEWNEVNDYGRRIAKDWQDTANRARSEIRRLIVERNNAGTYGNTPEAALGKMISVNKQLIRWWDRAENIARMQLPERDSLEREIEEWQKQLRDIKRRR